MFLVLILVILLLIMTIYNKTRESFKDVGSEEAGAPSHSATINFQDNKGFENYKNSGAVVIDRGVVSDKLTIDQDIRGKHTIVQTFDVSTRSRKKNNIIIGGLQIHAERKAIPGPEISIKMPGTTAETNLSYEASFWDEVYTKAQLVDDNVSLRDAGFKYIYVKPVSENYPARYSLLPVSFDIQGSICLVRVYFNKIKDGVAKGNYDFLVKVWFNTFEQDKISKRKWRPYKHYDDEFTWANLNSAYNKTKTFKSLNVQLGRYSRSYVGFNETLRSKRYSTKLTTGTDGVYAYDSPVSVKSPDWDGRIAFYNPRSKRDQIYFGITNNNGDLPFTSDDSVLPSSVTNTKYRLNRQGLDFIYPKPARHGVNLYKQRTNDLALTIDTTATSPVIQAFVNGVNIGSLVIGDDIPYEFYRVSKLHLSAIQMDMSRTSTRRVALRNVKEYAGQVLNESQLKAIHYENMTDEEKLELCEDNVNDLKYKHKVDLMIEDAKLDTVKGQRNEVQDVRISEKKTTQDKLEADEYNTHRRAKHYHKKFKKFELINKVLIAILAFFILIALIGLAFKSTKVRNFVQEKYAQIGYGKKSSFIRRGAEIRPFRADGWGR